LIIGELAAIGPWYGNCAKVIGYSASRLRKCMSQKFSDCQIADAVGMRGIGTIPRATAWKWLNRERQNGGFSLTELLVAMTVLGALLALAIPQFIGYKSQAEIAVAIQDLRVLDNHINAYKIHHEELPAALSDVPSGTKLDPWGQPYQYLMIEGNSKAKGEMRKDKNLVPINSDFDLYSMGPDGNTTPPLTAKTSHDDIIRANNGGYFGVASKY
jgi:general secretion pathway protein G